MKSDANCGKLELAARPVTTLSVLVEWNCSGYRVTIYTIIQEQISKETFQFRQKLIFLNTSAQHTRQSPNHLC